MEKMIYVQIYHKNTCMGYLAYYVDAEKQQGTGGREMWLFMYSPAMHPYTWVMIGESYLSYI